jgi:hypothetical protein
VASILLVQWVVLLVSASWFSVVLVILVATAPRLLSTAHALLSAPDRHPGLPR